jgi:PAS domain-containing protein
MVRVFSRLTRLLRNRGLGGGSLLALTLNNMTQGVVLFELGGRLVVCNDQYLRMYGLSPDFVGPGSHLKDIVAERVKTGSLQRDPAEYCAELMRAMAAGQIVRFVSETSDGRAVSVVNRAIPGFQLLGRNTRRYYRVAGRRKTERSPR